MALRGLGVVACAVLLAACGQATTTLAQPASANPESSPNAPVEASPPAAAEPTAGPTQVLTPAPTAQPTAAPLPPAKRIGPLTFISQTLNNCGPASVAEDLDYWGIQRTQAQVASVLRPDLPLYGMSLYGVPFYATSVGLSSFESMGGTQQLIKAFVANGIPVIVSDLVSQQEHIRHFRPI
ncbi:MAG TPA: C39 family peptidase, partial [Chloroflexota bacterium]|nr:C39 family peptidase [Chloroflexota bacterium]